ncbi:MAG: cytochrome c oxidase subunit 2A [Caldilineaceae bacterium]|nr:cytochrome c oxidase subunit 2A [Caldilineaceae bacterium]
MKEPRAPQGTIALMALFALLILIFWANTYFIVLSRGVTQ